jgi:hypothetical protein
MKSKRPKAYTVSQISCVPKNITDTKTFTPGASYISSITEKLIKRSKVAASSSRQTLSSSSITMLFYK